MRLGIGQHTPIGFADAVVASVMIGNQVLPGRAGNFGIDRAAAVDLGINAGIALILLPMDMRGRQDAAEDIIGEQIAILQACPEIGEFAAERFIRVAADDAIDGRTVDDGDFLAGRLRFPGVGPTPSAYRPGCQSGDAAPGGWQRSAAPAAG